MISRILVSTDGSAEATRAVEFAAGLAARYDAELILHHVFIRDHLPEGLRHMAEVEGGAGAMPGEMLAGVPEARFPADMVLGTGEPSPGVYVFIGEQVIEAARDIARKQGADKVRDIMEDGDPARRILERIESEKADVVVTGTRGIGGLRGLLQGSVSHKVAQLASCTGIRVR